MRFVRVNTADGTHKNYKRNCIAAAKVKIDKCAETEKTNKRLNRVLDAEYEFTYSEGKLRRRFSFKKTAEFIKREALAFYNELNKKTAAAALTAVSAMVVALVFNINFSFAYNAFMNGTELGYVPDKAYVQQCMDSINSEFSQYVSGQEIISGDVVYVPAIIRRGAYTDTFALSENIKSTSDVMAQAYAVEVDGIAYTALSDRDSAENVLSRLASEYKFSDTTEISFAEDVQVLYEYVPLSILLDDEQALTRLRGYTTLHNTVTVDSPVSVAEFAAANEVDEEYFRSLNTELGDYIDASMEVIVPDRKPVITVITSDMVSYDTQVPFEEQVTEDATMYEGTEKLLQIGVEGVNTVTERIERANGKVINQTVVASQVVSEPIMQMRAVGTMERPANVGTGSFLRPYYGSISSRFGSRRSGNHTGVDFCGNVGDPIAAADNGTVIFSGWSGGYGNVIKIDHNNGYVTYYAHCSKLYADVGDIVEKGETIAAVGNTGNSTGPHVHFEIRYNDTVLNPMNYVN